MFFKKSKFEYWIVTPAVIVWLSNCWMVPETKYNLWQTFTFEAGIWSFIKQHVIIVYTQLIKLQEIMFGAFIRIMESELRT